MQDLCPSCLKNGWKSRLKLFQINLEEAMLSCEAEDCAWPLGYENFSYFPRKVGKTWSYHWDDFAAKPQHQHEVTNKKPVQAKSIFAPDDDVEAFETKDIVSIASEHSYHMSNPSQQDCSEEQNSSSSPTSSVDETCAYDEETDAACKTSSVSEIQEFLLETENNEIYDKANTIIPEGDDFIDLTRMIESNKISCPKTRRKCASQNAGNTRELPQITSIEKTNIDISNLLADNPAPAFPDCDKVKPVDHKKPAPQSLPVKCTKFKATGKQGPPAKPVTKVPIVITCPKLPAQKQSVTPQKSNNNISAASGAKKNSLKALKAEILQSRLRQPIKKLSSGKEYQKFSFSVIKKQMGQKEQSKDQESAETGSTVQNLDVAEVTNAEVDKKNCDTKYALDNTEFGSTGGNVVLVKTESTDCRGSDEVSGTRRMTLGETSHYSDYPLNSTFDNSSASIDIVLDDLLNKDHSVSENISDDWITSLLD